MNIVLDNANTLGSPVRRGNVYANKTRHRKRRYDYKLVVAVLGGEADPVFNMRAPWNNIVVLHLTQDGRIVGSAVLPERYVQHHHYLVGSVPAAEHKWFQFNVRELQPDDEYMVVVA